MPFDSTEVRPPLWTPAVHETVVELTRGFSTIIDLADLELVRQHSWWTQLDEYTAYAASEFREGSKRRKLFMHRLITDAPKGTVVDHWDDHGLNNRRENLKVVGYNDNAQKVWFKAQMPSASKYRGVSKYPGGQWRARLSFMGEDIHLGIFSDEIAAAEAYDNKIRELYGPYGWTNFDNPVLKPAFLDPEQIPF